MDKIGELFLSVVNMSVTAGIAVLFVLAARVLLKKAPKFLSYLLWIVVGFRMVCPYSLPTVISFFNLEVIQEHTAAENAVVWNFTRPQAEAGITDAGQNADDRNVIDGSSTQKIRGDNTKQSSAESTPVREPASRTNILALVWILGIAALFIREAVLWRRLRKRIAQATKYDANIYECDTIDSPFVMGIVRPRIYLPYRLGEKERQYILLHEQYHIRRRDYLVKPAAMILLILHWFNPLVWAAYHFMCEDMEMSCDEQVLNKLGDKVKTAYSTSLLTFATDRRWSDGGILAFGENQAKSRIRNVLCFEKPAKRAVAGAGILCVFVALLVMGNAKQQNRIQYKGEVPGGGFEVSYKVEPQINSYLIYRETCENGEVTGYEVVTSGTFGTGNGEQRRSGKVQSARILGGQEEPNIEESWSMAENYIVDAGAKEFNPEAEKDFVIAARHLGTGESGSVQALPCKDYDREYQNTEAWTANDREVLYWMVLSKQEEQKLREKFEVSPTVQRLWELRNPYIGDAPADGRILGKLGVGLLGDYTTELLTTEEPYVLIIHFKEQPEDEVAFYKKMRKKAMAALTLIENADEVRWTYPVDGQKEVRKWRFVFSDIYGIKDFKSYARSPVKLQELLQLVEEGEGLHDNVERTSEGFKAPDGEIYKYELDLIGTTPNAEYWSYFHVFTNEKDLTFSEVTWSMLSGNMKDRHQFYISGWQ